MVFLLSEDGVNVNSGKNLQTIKELNSDAGGCDCSIHGDGV
jgi:hypothetical protein